MDMRELITNVNIEKIERTMKALEKNNMTAHFAKDHDELIEIVKSIAPEGSTVSCGGTVTISQCGVLDLMRSGYYNFLDRAAPGITPEGVRDVYRKTFDCDAFFCSSNAITEKGELYNVDGNGNRLQNVVHGPKHIIVIAGINKIVRDLDAAVYRTKTIACPANARRQGIDVPCAKLGRCIAADKEMTDGCNAPGRMCISYVITGYQRIKDRIHVIFLNEELGF